MGFHEDNVLASLLGYICSEMEYECFFSVVNKEHI